MLKTISELPDQDKWNAIVRGWVAVDPDSGAQLTASHGRTGQAPKYILILPNRSVVERGGLFTNYEWDYPKGRKFLRAWSDK